MNEKVRIYLLRNLSIILDDIEGIKNLELDFIIGDRGEILCRTHTEFPYLEAAVEELSQSREEGHLQEKLPVALKKLKVVKSCKTCGRYINNSCDISSAELDKIYSRVRLKRFRCEFCGGVINKQFYVIYKRVMEKKKSVTIPLICCVCSENLKSKDRRKAFREDLRNYLLMSSGSLILTIFLTLLMLYVAFPALLSRSLFIKMMFLITVISVPTISTIFFFIKFLKLKIALWTSKTLKEFLNQ